MITSLYYTSHISAIILDELLEVWNRGFIKDDVINGRLINSNSFLKQPVEQCIVKTLKLHHHDPRTSPFGDSVIFNVGETSVLEAVHW